MIGERVEQTSTTSGTGTLNLTGTVLGRRTFVGAIGSGNKCYYAIEENNGQDWEIGIGTVTSATPDTLTRETVIASSNSDALVNFTGATKTVWLPVLAEHNSVNSGRLLFGVMTNVGNDYSLVLRPKLRSWTGNNAARFLAKVPANNTGPVTLNVNGAGVKNVRKGGDKALADGDWRIGMWVELTYDETNDVVNWMDAPEVGGFLAVTGTSYTSLSSDHCRLVRFTNAAAVAVTLPQANTAGFANRFRTTYRYEGDATLTITPTTSTINGQATLVLGPGQEVTFESDGTNYLLYGDTQAARSIPVVVAYAATVNIDLSKGNNFQITRTGALTLGAPTKVNPGQSGVITLIEDGTGGHSVSFDTIFKTAGDEVITVPTTANNITHIYYYVHSATHIAISAQLDAK